MPQTQVISSSASDFVIALGDGTFSLFFLFTVPTTVSQKGRGGEGVFPKLLLQLLYFIQSPVPTQNTLNSPLCNFNLKKKK